jgi:hypothetical protein
MAEPKLINFGNINLLADHLYDDDNSAFTAFLFTAKPQQEWGRIARNIYKLPAFIELVKSMKPVSTWEAVIPESVSDALKRGDLTLRAAKDGTGVVPALVNRQGKIVHWVRLAQQECTPQLLGALNNFTLQVQVGEIIQQLQALNERLKAIERGQRDNRIAMALGAKQKLIEALAIHNSNLRNALLIEAVSSANTARAQLMESMKTDVRVILSRAPGSKTETMNEVRRSFTYINMATGIIATAYSVLGEPLARAASLKAYQHFLNTIVLKQVGKDSLLQRLNSWDSVADDMWIKEPTVLNRNLALLIKNTDGRLRIGTEENSDGRKKEGL